MDIGQTYVKHVRGSRYLFGRDGIFYVHPTKRRFELNIEESDLVDRLIDLKGSGGRLLVNEKREMVIYRQESDHHIPIYAGRLDGELNFNSVPIDPSSLTPGLLWPGFNSHHGSRFLLDSKGSVRFKETSFENGVKTTRYFPVKMDDQQIIETIRRYKPGGAFFINEYGHTWFPVEVSEFQKHMTDYGFKKKIDGQWKHFSKASKNIINHYSRPNRRSKGFVPVYAGQYLGEMKVFGREDKPRIIYGREESDWNEL